MLCQFVQATILFRVEGDVRFVLFAWLCHKLSCRGNNCYYSPINPKRMNLPLLLDSKVICLWVSHLTSTNLSINANSTWARHTVRQVTSFTYLRCHGRSRLCLFGPITTMGRNGQKNLQIIIYI